MSRDLHPKHRHELNLRRGRGDGLRAERDLGAGLRLALTEAGVRTWEPCLDCFWRTTPEANTLAALNVIVSSFDETAVALLRRLSAGYVCDHEGEVRDLLPKGWPADRREALMRELKGEAKRLTDAGSSKEAPASDDKSPASNVVPLRGHHRQ